jgi:dimethylargininase
MFNYVIARQPCANMVDGLTSSSLGKPDYKKALAQHAAYLQALEKCDVEVIVLPPDENFPDSVFVEDTVLCTPECAIITRPGASSRRGETDVMTSAIKKFYKKIEYIADPGTLDAGDVMMVGSHYYIGVSARTNLEGAHQLISILETYGMSGSVVPLKNVLHLKTGLAYLENNNLLAAGEFVTKPEFKKYNVIDISITELYAANCIWVNGRVIMPAGFAATQKKISELGYEVIPVNTSEFEKLDGGVSCMSLRF